MKFRQMAAVAATALVMCSLAARPTFANYCNSNGCQINLSGHININNNWWGVSQGCSSGSQDVWTSGSNNWGSNYNWSAGCNQYQVKTYPEAIDGWNWSSSFNGAPFPKQISGGANLYTTANNVYAGNGTQDTIWDCFFSYSRNPGGSNPAHELEVWLTASINPSGYRYTTTVDNVSYNVYYSYGSWGIIAYVPSYTSSRTVNIMHIAKDACNHGYMSTNEYCLGIDFGTEIYHGSGSLNVGYYSAP